MAKIEMSGFMDGQPAKFVYYPDQDKLAIFWGGIGMPDGPGKNHAMIVHPDHDITSSNDRSLRFVRVDGVIKWDHKFDDNAAKKEKLEAKQRKQKVGLEVAQVLAGSFRKAVRFNLRQLRGGR